MQHPDLLPFDELWPTVARRIDPLENETINVAEALKRVLRQDAAAGWDLPMADNSAMDGFAVRSADTQGAPACRLQILKADAYAGTNDRVTVEAGTAVAIGTGGLLPSGADAVAIKEIVERNGEVLTVMEPVAEGAHIRRAGDELRRGDVVVPAGQRMMAPQIVAAAAAGIRDLTVSRLPRVTVMATGSELVSIGSEARPGQVVNTNTPLLAMQIEGLLGIKPRTPGHAIDDRDVLHAALVQALETCDVLVLSGGVSVGDRDLVKNVLETELGVERIVWRVAQKPGKPTYVGRRAGTVILGLPGNPAAVATAWHTLVRPVLLAMMGVALAAPERLPVRLVTAVRPNHLRTHLRWGRSDWRGDELWLQAFARSDSHMLSDFARSDLLAIIPAGNTELAAGTGVEALRILDG